MTKPDFGLDAPGVVRNLSLGGAALLLLGMLAPPTRPGTWPTGAFLLLESLWMIWASRVGKFVQRERLLDKVTWTGNEQVLDLGCGRGLLLLGVAARLTRGGQAVGIDLWSAEDLSHNNPEATQANAALLGLESRVRIETGDMRTLPFADASFDVIVSSMAVHNIPTAEGRVEALREAVRVLKPGGTLLLQDFRHTRRYRKSLEALGLQGVRRLGPSFWIFPPVHVVMGTR